MENRKTRLKLYWEQNKEKLNQQRREQYTLNPEKYKQRSHKYFLKNKQIIIKKQKDYWNKTKDEQNEKRRLEYQQNKKYREDTINRAQNYYQKNKDKIIQKRTEYFLKNRIQVYEYAQQKYKEFKEQVINILGYKKCIKCGYSKDERALQFDHVKGGGSKQRKTIGSLQQLRLLVKNPEKTRKEIQILCGNCNVIKSRTNENEFGHNNRKYSEIKKTPTKKLEQLKISKKIRIRKFKEKLFDILGRKCVKCGYNENILAIQFDHIIAIGNKKRIKGYDFYRLYSMNEDKAKHDLQPLCVNCNQIKKFENKEFGYIKQNPI